MDAGRKVHSLLNTGHTQVIEADLRGYVDSIPHAELMRSVARRISDRYRLHRIKGWLMAPVEEDDGWGGRRRTTRAKDTKRGIPQGAPISPLLSNGYLRRFVLGWKGLGLGRRLNAPIVNFADDVVICGRGTAEEAMVTRQAMMRRLASTVNEAKTQTCRVPDETVDFLGYTLGRCYSSKTGRAFIGTRPSKKSIHRVGRAISDMTGRRWGLMDSQERVDKLNRLLVGWSHYFCLGPVSEADKAVDAHARTRIRRWLCKQHKQPGKGTSRYPDEYRHDTLGLIRLEQRPSYQENMALSEVRTGAAMMRSVAPPTLRRHEQNLNSIISVVSRSLFPTRFYLLRPWSRVVKNSG